jgi:predicted metalloprotease with PDZ domain
MQVASVQADGPAHRAGIAPGDEILALAGLRVDTQKWQEILQALAAPDHNLAVLLARRGVIQQLEVSPKKNPGSVSIELDMAAVASARQLRQGWIGYTPSEAASRNSSSLGM